MPVISDFSSSTEKLPAKAKLGYRNFLLKLEKMFKPEDLKNFKYAVQDFIPADIMSSLYEARDVFSALEKSGKLGPGKFDELREILEQIDRPKMIELVDEFDDANSKFPLKPRSDNRLEKDGCSVSIKGGRHFETNQGEYVEVRSGSNYSLTLSNNNNCRCLINIQIDGYEMFPIGFIFAPKQTYTIERSSTIEKKFKFFAIRDRPDESGINEFRKDKNGVIQVKFTPERADMKITCVASGKKTETISCSTEVTDDDFLEMVSKVFDNAVVTVMINSWKPLGKHGTKLTEYGIGDGSRINVNVGGVGGHVVFEERMSTEKIEKKSKKSKYIAGATTLEGESDQKFGSAKSFPIDPSLAVALNLRLVAREDVKPLPSTGNPTPLARATLIPPPVSD